MVIFRSDTFAWTAGAIHLEVVLGLALLAGVYAWAWRARRRRGGARSAHHPLLFGAGLGTLAVALNGPLHDLSDAYLLSAHMVQHLLITLVAPPLLLAGTPGWMLDPLLAPRLAGRVAGPVLRVLLRPLPQFAIYAAALVGWHLPAAYQTALEIHAVHGVQHVTMIGAAVLGWWPILSPSRLAPPLPYAAQLLYLWIFQAPMTVVAAMITSADDLLYPVYAAAPRVSHLSPLADQQLAGIIMWVPASVVPVTLFTVIFFRWVAAEPA